VLLVGCGFVFLVFGVFRLWFVVVCRFGFVCCNVASGFRCALGCWYLVYFPVLCGILGVLLVFGFDVLGVLLLDAFWEFCAGG